MKTKIDPKYAVEAILLQLRKYREDGEDHIVFVGSAIHPEADDGCTFGDLIDALPTNGECGVRNAESEAESEDAYLFDKLAKLAADLDAAGDEFQAAYSIANQVAGLKLLPMIELARGMSRDTDALLAAIKADTKDPRAKVQ